jgi:transposase
MQLSEHDLKQLDEEKIRSLQAQTLQTLSLKLLADLKEARDRLNQRPDNSSRPPSTRVPWEGGDSEPRDDDEAQEQRRKTQRKRGKRAIHQPERKTKRARGRSRVSG